VGDYLIPQAGGRWTPEEEERLLQFYKDGLSRQAMGKILGRSVQGIQKKASMLNITRREFCRAKLTTGRNGPGRTQELKYLEACNEAFCKAMEAAGYVRRIGITVTNSSGSTR
jgi:hypothetical protein